MNQCVLTGNLGADPKSFYTPEGLPIASFEIAFRSGKKTSWMRVSCFNKLAELAVKCLHTGARVGVVGYLDQQKWTSEDNVQKSGYRLIANSLEFIKTDGRGFDHKEGDTEADGRESTNDDSDVPF